MGGVHKATSLLLSSRRLGRHHRLAVAQRVALRHLSLARQHHGALAVGASRTHRAGLVPSVWLGAAAHQVRAGCGDGSGSASVGHVLSPRQRDRRFCPDLGVPIRRGGRHAVRVTERGSGWGRPDDHHPLGLSAVPGPRAQRLVSAVSLGRDWETIPPELVWRQPIGEGWSSSPW